MKRKEQAGWPAGEADAHLTPDELAGVAGGAGAGGSLADFGPERYGRNWRLPGSPDDYEYMSFETFRECGCGRSATYRKSSFVNKFDPGIFEISYFRECPQCGHIEITKEEYDAGIAGSGALL